MKVKPVINPLREEFWVIDNMLGRAVFAALLVAAIFVAAS